MFCKDLISTLAVSSCICRLAFSVRRCYKVNGFITTKIEWKTYQFCGLRPEQLSVQLISTDCHLLSGLRDSLLLAGKGLDQCLVLALKFFGSCLGNDQPTFCPGHLAFGLGNLVRSFRPGQLCIVHIRVQSMMRLLNLLGSLCRTQPQVIQLMLHAHSFRRAFVPFGLEREQRIIRSGLSRRRGELCASEVCLELGHTTAQLIPVTLSGMTNF